MNIGKDLQKGDLVKLLGQDQIGAVVQIIGAQKVLVSFEYLMITVPLSQVQRVKKTAKISSNKPIAKGVCSQVINLNNADLLAFSPELDLHGMYVEEALYALDQWLDKAFLFEHKHVRIIHGIGKGILRQKIRIYLSSHRLVKKVLNNHPFQGAGGVTVVELY